MGQEMILSGSSENLICADEMNDAVLFYRSFYEAIKELDDTTQVQVYNSIFQYALNDVEPDLKGVASAVFKLIRPHIDANNRRRENGMKGGRKKTEPEPNQNQSETKTKPKPNLTETKTEPNSNQSESKPEGKYKIKNININKNIKEKESKEKERSPEGDTKKSRFIPPTVEEVRMYCEEKGYSVDPQRFVDFYNSKNWMVGKNKMTSWHSAVSGWEARNKESPPQYKSSADKAHNFHERETDYEAAILERIRKGVGG